MKHFISIIIFFSLFSFSEAYSQGCNGSASFTYVNNGNAEVSFTNTSSVAGSITAVAWNFGDGSTSNQSNPTHTYGANGYYTVTLNVTSVQDFGYYGTLTCNDATSNNIMVNNSNSAYGCMDISACNYDPTATVDDGSCILSSTWVTLQMSDSYGDGWGGHTWSAISTTGGNSYGPYTLNSGNSGWEAFCIADDCYDVICEVVGWNYQEESWSLTDENGTVLASGGIPYNSMLETGAGCSTSGCMDQGACNYDSLSTIDDGSCIYANPLYDCDGNCLNDLDEDNICDEIDDCVGEWIEDVSYASCSSLGTSNPSFCDAQDNCSYSWLTYSCGGGTYEVDNSYCEEIEGGCTNSEACNYDSLADADNGSCEFTSCLDECGVLNGDNSSCTDECGIVNGSGPNQYQDCEGNCLNDLDEDNICDEIDDCLGEWVEDIETGYCGSLNTYSSCYAFSDCSWSCMGGWYLGECVGYYGCGGGYYEENNSYCDAFIIGCIDSEACNYDALSTVDDGSCIYANPLYDCEGNCLNDVDEDNICDEIDDCVGEWVEDIETGNCSIFTSYGQDVCTSYTGCEWVYSWGGWVSGGSSDCMYTYEIDNSYCNELVVGCTDSLACNYNTEAAVESGECIYTEVGYDCDGVLLCPLDLDLDGYTGVPDLLIVLSSFGCISDCFGDVNGDGVVAVDDLLSLLSSFGFTCE